MAESRVYPWQVVKAAVYYDVVELMGEEGMEARLTAYDLLAVMAAPCTRLDYENTEKRRCTKLMTAVHGYMLRNRKLTNLNHQALVRELDRGFLPTLTDEQMRVMLKEFGIVMDFDADGCAIFNKKYYDVYKGNMEKGHGSGVRYAALRSGSVSAGLPDNEVSRVYQTVCENGVYHLDLDFTVEDWVEILRGASVKAMELVGAFCRIEGRRATHAEIEANSGILSDTINGITAGLGTRAKRIMGVEVLGVDGNPSCWIVPFNNGGLVKSGEFVWELRSEVAEAYERVKER